MLIDLPDPRWADKAECLMAKGHDPELWFAPKGSVEADEAKGICSGCPVAAQCLEWALSQPQVDDHGILGGLDEVQRGRIRRATA